MILVPLPSEKKNIYDYEEPNHAFSYLVYLSNNESGDDYIP